MRFRLRTLLILMAVGPPLLAGMWWAWPRAIESYRKPSFHELIALIQSTIHTDSWDHIGGPGSIDEFQSRCFLVDGEGNPDGPDPCGRSYSFTPYSEYAKGDGGEFPSLQTPAGLVDDPFAIVK